MSRQFSCPACRQLLSMPTPPPAQGRCPRCGTGFAINVAQKQVPVTAAPPMALPVAAALPTSPPVASVGAAPTSRLGAGRRPGVLLAGAVVGVLALVACGFLARSLFQRPSEPGQQAERRPEPEKTTEEERPKPREDNKSPDKESPTNT